MSNNVPVLLKIYNRPEVTAKAFERIRAARPRALFVDADGPRPDRPQDEEACRAARALIQVDWPCELVFRSHDTNSGCKMSMFRALNWFFDQVEEGIVLEDDCVAELSFFPYVEELLARYRHETKVFGISGNDFIGGVADASYYFIRTTHIWGWATWRRSWRLVDLKASDYPELVESGLFRRMFVAAHTAEFWRSIVEDLYGGLGNSWSGSLIYAMAKHDMLGVSPSRNLVTNIGFGKTGTHPMPEDHKFANLATSPMEFPLRHPVATTLSVDFDRYVEQVWEVRPSGAT